MGKIFELHCPPLYLYYIKTNRMFQVVVIESNNNSIITRDWSDNYKRTLLEVDRDKEWILFADKKQAEKYRAEQRIKAYSNGGKKQ